MDPNRSFESFYSINFWNLLCILRGENSKGIESVRMNASNSWPIRPLLNLKNTNSVLEVLETYIPSPYWKSLTIYSGYKKSYKIKYILYYKVPFLLIHNNVAIFQAFECYLWFFKCCPPLGLSHISCKMICALIE